MGFGQTAALRYWHTMRHFHTAQLWWRLRYRIAPPVMVPMPPRPLPDVNQPARTRLAAFLDQWAHHTAPEDEITDAFLKGRFTFLNKTVQSRTPPWQGLDVPKLWAYHLHYMDFARDLALRHPAPEGEVAITIHDWIHHWIAANPPGTPIAWDAFPISTRLINWSLILARYSGFDDAVLGAMHHQLAFLSTRCEYDLRGNHLLRNAAALTLAGTLLNSPLQPRGLALLKREVAAQFLPDGGHIEGSSLYHGQALFDLIQVAGTLDPVPSWLEQAIEKGLAHLHALTHDDGRLAQFNDGAAEEGIAPATLRVLGALVLPPQNTTADYTIGKSGIYRLDRIGDTMLVKACPPLSHFQPGHAHSDLLSFEFSQGAQRIFVNGGTHGYAESPYRDWCRGTRNHNTIYINGRDQHEHWSTFRVARRVHGAAKRWDGDIPRWVAAYTSLDHVRHVRTITCNEAGYWLVHDDLRGPGPLHLESRLHLHPDMELDPVPASVEGAAYRVTAPGTKLLLVLFGGEVAVIPSDRSTGDGHYFPRFGLAIPAPTLAVMAHRPKEHRMGFAIASLPPDTDFEALLERLIHAWKAPQHRP